MKRMRIPANGTVLHVEEHSSKGEALVFLPYQSGQTVMWSDMIPQFTDHYRVIALDMRGFGQSDQPESGYDLDTMAEDLRGVLDALGIERAHFIGNSLGGYASTNFASKHPERALSLVNIESAMLTDTSPGTRFAGMTREEAQAWTLPQKLANIERYSANLPFTKTVVLPNSGHLMPYFQSEEVAAEVLQFFEEIR